MKIITVHVFPPIPIRYFDWHAYLDGQEGSFIQLGQGVNDGFQQCAVG